MQFRASVRIARMATWSRLCLIAVCAALVPTLCGCPKQAAPAARAPAPSPTAAADPAPATPPIPANVKQVESAPAPEASENSKGNPYGDKYTANKTRDEGDSANAEVLERSLADLRPKPKRDRNRVGSGTMVHIEFSEATLNLEPNAHLHNLHFTLHDGENAASVVLTDKQRDVAATLSLGWCGIKLKPRPGKGEIVPIGSGTVRNRVERVGSYDLVLLDGKGKALATAQITDDRRLITGDGKPGYQIWLRQDPDWPDDQVLHIGKVGADNRTTKMMLLRWHDHTMQIRELRDKVGNEFEYKFPVGRLEVIKPPE